MKNNTLNHNQWLFMTPQMFVTGFPFLSIFRRCYLKCSTCVVYSELYEWLFLIIQPAVFSIVTEVALMHPNKCYLLPGYSKNHEKETILTCRDHDKNFPAVTWHVTLQIINVSTKNESILQPFHETKSLSYPDHDETYLLSRKTCVTCT